MRIIRVFPRRTKMTPDDAYSFVGDPPFWRPKADEVHISVTFTWDIEEGIRLKEAWGQYYHPVYINGFAINRENQFIKSFIPGMYVKHGITITSRGCNNHCPWCLIDIPLCTIPIEPGHIIQDNNLLQCPQSHLDQVFAMLRSQKRAIKFSGGLDSTRIGDYVVDQLRRLQIDELFLAADTKEAIKPLRKAVNKLSFLPRDKLRCYVMIGYNGETISNARDRLEEVWEVGCLPFSQLYQPPDKYIDYSPEWKELNWLWSRPAATKAIHLTLGARK